MLEWCSRLRSSWSGCGATIAGGNFLGLVCSLAARFPRFSISVERRRNTKSVFASALLRFLPPGRAFSFAGTKKPRLVVRRLFGK